MFKIIGVGSWNKFAEESVSAIPMTENFFTFNDQKSFMKKRASSLDFINKVSNYQIKKGEVPIHVIAIGETESYGCNRNGDGFNRETCKSQHPTFVKHGKYYRHHKSQDKSKNYGKIAESYYNPDMGRIELLVIGNGTKEAADRNGGLVIPDSTLQKIAEGKDVAWSMGCSLPHDICTVCGNKAASPKDYCTEDTCINPKTGEHHPGCKEGLTKISADGIQQFVENPDCTFYDISEVGIPADRTAFGWKADYVHDKTASDKHVIGGAELAELYGFNFDMTGNLNKVSQLKQIMYKLASIEDKCNDDDTLMYLMKIGSIIMSQDQGVLKELKHLSTSQQNTALMKLAQKGVILTPENYFRLKNAELAADAPFALRKYLPNIYNELIEADDFTKFAEFIPSTLDNRYSSSLSNSLNKFANNNSINEKNIAIKVGTAIVNDMSKLNVSTHLNANLSKLAVEYAIYKAASLLEFPIKDRDFACKVAVCENYLV